jgi:hypothetical protein
MSRSRSLCTELCTRGCDLQQLWYHNEREFARVGFSFYLWHSVVLLTFSRLSFENTESTDTGSRVYLLANTTEYQTFNLLNKEIAFDIDVSTLDCGYPFQALSNAFLQGVSARTFWLFVWDDKQKFVG